MGLAVFGFILGLILGSFSKATAERVLHRKSLRGRSYCPGCKKELRWYDLFPVFSYFILRGRCRFCKNPIPKEDLLTEIVTGFLTAFVLWVSFPQLSNLNFFFNLNINLLPLLLNLIFESFVICILVIIFWVDLKSGLIPDKITFPAILIAILYLLISSGLESWFFYQNFLASPFSKYLMFPQSGYLVDHLMRIWQNVFLSFVSASALAAFFIILIVITRGRGMGWGDVKYIFFLGLALGFPNIILSTMSAFLLGACVSLVLIVIKRKHFGQTIPFGPFLSLGAIFSLIFGNQIINWYLSGLM